MKSEVVIDGRTISPDHPPYVIAEMSGNHNGSFERAIGILQSAKQAGADAVKLQTYTADTMTIDHDGPEFELTEGQWAGRSLYELYDWAHTPWEWHESLFKMGRELGITIFSTPFDQSAVNFLSQFDPPAYKIASFEILDIPLIRHVASIGKPMILSTGMASRKEIAEAVTAAREEGCLEICLLHCTSGYPTPPEESDLLTLPDLIQEFGETVGISDHTQGTVVSVAAVALGACVVEKHLTQSRLDGGPDSTFSLEPLEFNQLVRDVDIAYRSLGSVRSEIRSSEIPQRSLRRSLYAVEEIKVGEAITENNVRSIRPGLGLSPSELPKVIGQVAVTTIARGTPLNWNLISVDQL